MNLNDIQIVGELGGEGGRGEEGVTRGGISEWKTERENTKSI